MAGIKIEPAVENEAASPVRKNKTVRVQTAGEKASAQPKEG